MRKNLIGSLLLAAFLFQSVALAQAPALKISSAERKMAEGVTAKQLSDYLYFVASDEMEGRDTPSRGLDTTAKFIAFNLSKWGFKPAGDDGTFFQKIALKSEVVDPSNTSVKIGDASFAYGDDVFRVAGNGSASGPMVFAGNGWVIKSKSIDAYSGVDISGKVVVVYGQGQARPDRGTNPPTGITAADMPGRAGTEWSDPITYARTHGAKGVIVIASEQVQSGWEQRRSAPVRPSMYPEKLRDAPSPLPVVLVSAKVGDAILAGASGNRASTSAFEIAREATVNSATKADTKWTQNVVALWEGSDSTLKNEMVAIGAHYDHIGVSTNPNALDKINNGADDDGSGTVSVLSIAEALAHSPTRPKRSVLFVWHCGEEKGLWGSAYFNKFPTVDIKQVTAQLNIDMIGRSKKPGYMAPCDTNPAPGRKPCNETLSGENQIYVIGKDMMSSGLGNIVSGVNAGYLNLNYDTRYDDPKDPNRFFFRSDHFNYAVNGIPIAFWFDGEHEDYHRPGDEPQKIDYNKMEKVARSIMITLLKLADLKERPKIDKQLPPELSQRN